MKIFAINKEQCTDCNRCYVACPVKAIVRAKDGVSIDYDECIACGLCFKACMQSAVTINVDTQKINEYIETARQVKEQSKRIENLEAENKSLRRMGDIRDARLQSVINRLPVAVAAFSRNNRMLFSNRAFTDLLDYESRIKMTRVSDIGTINMDELLPAEISQIIQNALHSGEETITADVEMGGLLVGLSIHPLKKEGGAVAMFRNLSDVHIAREEIEARLNSVIDQSMAMVQNIGFLMGEETSKTTKILNSIIHSITSREK